MIHQPKIAIHGVSHVALHLGRACALRGLSVLGLFDKDPVRALRAALFLGISAQSELSSLIEMKPDIVLCSASQSENLDVIPGDILWINLVPNKEMTATPLTCWAISELNSQTGMPEQITSEVPEFQFAFSGEAHAVSKATSFLRHLTISPQ